MPQFNLHDPRELNWKSSTCRQGISCLWPAPLQAGFFLPVYHPFRLSIPRDWSSSSAIRL